MELVALVDLGSDVNILSAYVATAHRILVEKGRYRTVESFGGGRLPTLGICPIDIILKDDFSAERIIRIRVDVLE